MLCGLLSLKELYQSKKALASLEKEIDRLLSIKNRQKAIEDRLFGIENVTIRSIDSQLLDIKIELDLIKKKNISQKEITTHDSN